MYDEERQALGQNRSQPEKRAIRRHDWSRAIIRVYRGQSSGSHHIFKHPDIPELINLQEVGGQAKPYQVKQFLALVAKHNLSLGEDQ